MDPKTESDKRKYGLERILIFPLFSLSYPLPLTHPLARVWGERSLFTAVDKGFGNECESSDREL